MDSWSCQLYKCPCCQQCFWCLWDSVTYGKNPWGHKQACHLKKHLGIKPFKIEKNPMSIEKNPTSRSHDFKKSHAPEKNPFSIFQIWKNLMLTQKIQCLWHAKKSHIKKIPLCYTKKSIPPDQNSDLQKKIRRLRRRPQKWRLWRRLQNIFHDFFVIV